MVTSIKSTRKTGLDAMSNTNNSVQISTTPKKVAIAVGSGFAKVFDGNQFYALRSLVTTQPSLTGTGASSQLIVDITNSTFAGSFAIGENLEASSMLLSLKDGLKADIY